jgi:hypothetical protein
MTDSETYYFITKQTGTETDKDSSGVCTEVRVGLCLIRRFMKIKYEI